MVYHSKLYFLEVAMVTPFKTWLSHFPWENIALFYTLHFNLKLYCSSFSPKIYSTNGSLPWYVHCFIFFSKNKPEFCESLCSLLGLQTLRLLGQDAKLELVFQCAFYRAPDLKNPDLENSGLPHNRKNAALAKFHQSISKYAQIFELGVIPCQLAKCFCRWC